MVLQSDWPLPPQQGWSVHQAFSDALTRSSQSCPLSCPLAQHDALGPRTLWASKSPFAVL